MELLILFLVVLSSLILGLFVYINNPNSITNKVFLILSSTIAIWSTVLYISVHTSDLQQTLVWVKLSTFFAVPMVVFFLILIHTFPKDRLTMTVKEQYGLLVIMIAAMIFSLSPYVFSSIEPINGSFSLNVGPGMIPFSTVVNGAAFLSIVLLINRLRKSKGILYRQLRYLFLGLMLMFGFTIVTIFLPVIFLKDTSFVTYGPLYSLLFLGFTAYSIVKHRLLEIKVIVARTVSYTLLVITIAILYISFSYGLSMLLIGEKISPRVAIFSVSLTLFIAFSFPLIRRYLERATDKVFFKDRYDSQTLLWNLSRTMASTLHLTNLTKKVLDQILESVRINYGTVVLIRNKSIMWTESSGDIKGRAFKGKDIYDLIHKSYNSHKKNEQILIYEELPEAEIKEMMRYNGVTIILPLVVRKDLIGGLLLGEKSSGEIYSSEDIDLLKIIAPEMAVAVKNALSFEEIRRFNITLEDEVKKATDRLRHANKRLKELDILKDEFVSIASHELRTPMTAIKSYLWMALNKSPQKLEEPLKKYLDISYQSTERLIRLVNDMLTVSRIERNKIEIKKELFDIFEITQLVYEELKISAQEKKIVFTLNKERTEKYQVLGDKEKLREVFQNLVGNALKFTPDNGKITISIKKDKSHVMVSVTDTGSGIPKEDMPKLFKKFSKIEYSYTKHSSQPGTGLGLYISKQIVSLHHGDITVQSEVDKGSMFTVSLPLKEDKGGETKKYA